MCCLMTHSWSKGRRNVLQHTATHCNTLQYTATHRNTHYTTLQQQPYVMSHDSFVEKGQTQRPVTHCSTLQYTATYWNTHYTTMHCHKSSMCCLMTHSLRKGRLNALQHTATYCNTLLHTATHCNTLQHTLHYTATRALCVVS